MRVLHTINVTSIGGIADFILNMHKYSKFQHDVKAYKGDLAPEMEQAGQVHWEGAPDDGVEYDVIASHTVGGWVHDSTFQWAKERWPKIKTVEVMHSPARSPTNPSLVDGFIGLNQAAVDLNPHMKNRVKIYAIANNVVPSYPVPAARPYDVGRVSRVVPEKCPDVFAQIAINIPNRKFILGGDGSMLEQIKRMGIPNLEFSGMVRNFTAFLSLFRVFAFPTNAECCCMSVAMAQSAGLPCVVQDIPPLRETTGGFAQFASTPVDFAFKIIGLLDCKVEARELAEEGLEWATRNFTPDVICGKWEAYLNGLCAS